jgi:hypothetical protein
MNEMLTMATLDIAALERAAAGPKAARATRKRPLAARALLKPRP